MMPISLVVLLLAGCSDDGGIRPYGDSGVDSDVVPSDGGPIATHGWRLGEGRATIGRANRAAVLLPSGRVVVAGGQGASAPAMTVDEYDPSTDQWQMTASPRPIRPGNHTANHLLDGRVLIPSGGGADIRLQPSQVAHEECYLYEPATFELTLTGALLEGRSHHAAVRLGDGTVFAIAGAGRLGDIPDTTPRALASSERYDPATEAWSAAASMAEPRWSHTATMLPDGRVLVVGGTDESGPVGSAEVYDPVADGWSPAGVLAEPRSWHVAGVLGSGRVLVAGGFAGRDAATSSVEIWDPAVSGFTTVEALPEAVAVAALAVLDEHRVLVVGGVRDRSTLEPTGQAVIFDDRTDGWMALEPLNVARFGHSAVRIDDGRVVVLLGRTSITGVEDRAEISEEPL